MIRLPVIIWLIGAIMTISPASAQEDIWNKETPLCIPLHRVHIPQKCFKAKDVKNVLHKSSMWTTGNLVMNYAYKLGWIDFVKLLNSENPSWGTYITNRNSNKTVDHWLCQLNSRWHKQFIKSKDFHNPLIQLRYCYDVWNKARAKWERKVMSTFHWYNVRNKRRIWYKFIN